MERNGQLYVPASLRLEKAPTVPPNVGGWVGARAGINTMERRKSCFPYCTSRIWFLL